jgi:hypothetical protein
MTRDKIEKLATLFLAIFATGLSVQMAMAGELQSTEWAGAAVAILGSIGLAVGVRVWPQPARATAKRR